MFDFFGDVSDTRRTTRIVLMAIILTTLPCYCLGFALWALAPDDRSSNPPQSTSATLGGATSSPNFTPTFTSFFTQTFTPQGGPLQPSPTQYNLFPTAFRTNTPFVFPTAFPTNTLFVLPTLTSAPTMTRTPTLAPSNTPLPQPTDTPIPQPTDTPIPLPTDTLPPPPTEPLEPTPTQESL
jgi:hypothetical protein